MSLISPTDQQKLREAFAEMSRSVRLVFVTQTLGCDTCADAKEILDELPPLSDKISIEEINLILDGDRARQYGIERAPGIAVLYEGEADGFADSRIRFVGVPAGYEFVSLIQAVLLAGGRRSNLSEQTRARLAEVDQPTVMQVFTTPT